MTRTRTSVLGATFILLAGALALTLVLLAGRSSGGNQLNVKVGASLSGPNSKEATAGEGPVGGYEAYLSASRTYPASGDSARGRRSREGDVQPNCEAGRPPRQVPWSPLPRFGRQVDAVRAAEVRAPARRHLLLGSDERHGEPHHDAGRRSGLQRQELPRLGRSLRRRRLARPNNVEAADPEWTQLSPDDLDQNSVGTLMLDPSDKKHDTLYLGTGEGNRCSSGCEAGVGIYKSTDGGQALEEAQRHVRLATAPTRARPRARTRSSAAASTRS